MPNLVFKDWRQNDSSGVIDSFNNVRMSPGFVDETGGLWTDAANDVRIEGVAVKVIAQGVVIE